MHPRGFVCLYDYFKEEIMFKNLQIILVVTIVMAGCATPYIQPVDGAISKLTLPLLSGKWGAGNGGGIQLGIKGNDGCGKLSQGIAPKTYDKDLTLNIVGDTDTFFSISRFYGEKYCVGYGMFHAVSNNEYILNIEKIENHCIVSVIEKNNSGAERLIKVIRAAPSAGSNIHVCPKIL